MERPSTGRRISCQVVGFSFDKEPLQPADDIRAINERPGRADTFEPLTGDKRFGGFHPDDAVEWAAGGAVDPHLIHFESGEVKVRGADGDSRFEIAIGEETA